MAAIATIKGTAIAPGVSRNGRLYTAELLGRAVERANAAIARGEPHTMLTHHGAEDDSTRIVGRVTSLSQREDGSVAFEAEIADTVHGRDIAALVTGDQPFLDGVSIRGAWRGPVRREQHDGRTVETADDLDLFGLDFTKTPGVLAARIERGAAPAESAEPGRLVYESVTEATAAATKAPYGDVPYADPGYLADKKKRYPLNNLRRAKAAWSYINQRVTAARYTANQLKRVKGRIKKALKQFGVTVTAETTVLPGLLAETAAFEPVAECMSDLGAGFSISARNGPISVNISAYDGIEPAELEVIAKAAMCAACDALRAMDPDLDADIDVPGAPNADTDGSMEARRPDDDQMETASIQVNIDGKRLREATAAQVLTAEERAAVQAAGFPPGTVITRERVAEALAKTAPAGPAAASVTTTQEVPAVSEPTPAAESAATPAPVIQLTQEQFAQLLGRTAPAPAAESAPPAPAAAPVEETEEQRIDRIVAEKLAAERAALEETLRAEVRQAGPARKGLRTETPGGAVAGGPSEDEIRRNTNETLLDWVSNGRYKLTD